VGQVRLRSSQAREPKGAASTDKFSVFTCLLKCRFASLQLPNLFKVEANELSMAQVSNMISAVQLAWLFLLWDCRLGRRDLRALFRPLVSFKLPTAVRGRDRQVHQDEPPKGHEHWLHMHMDYRLAAQALGNHQLQHCTS
jgi:hypothetical protein